jgi:haloacetate dehalogenase
MVEEDDLHELYGDVLDVWRPWAEDLAGGPFPSGHHMSEERPELLAERLLAFLS